MWKAKTVFRGHGAPVYAVASDGEWIYSAAGDAFVVRWNVLTGTQDAFTIRLDKAAYALHCAQHLLFVGSSNGTLIAVDPATKKMVWESNRYGHPIFAIESSSIHQQIIVGDSESNLTVFSLAGEKVVSFNLGAGKIRAIHISENRLFVGAEDGSVREFDLTTFNEVNSFQIHQSGVNHLLLLNKNELLSVGRDGYLINTDVLTGQRLFALPAHYQSIYGLEKVGQQLITCSMDKSIKIWNIESWKVIQKLEVKSGGHKRSVNALCAFNEQQFVSCGDDKEVILWEEISEL